MLAAPVIQYFRRGGFRLVTSQFLQPKFVLRHSNLFRSFSRTFTNSPPPPTPEDSPSYLNKIAKTTVLKLPVSIVVNLLVYGLFGLISVDLLYAWYRNRCNERLLNETLEKGTRPEIRLSDDEFTPRPQVVKRLKEILQPHKNQSVYHFVCGEHGTGKTTLTRIASREVGQGVIYVDPPSDVEDFGKAFGIALNFAFEEQISFTNQLMRKILGNTNNNFEGPKWKRAMNAFKCASEVYRAKHGKPPVIVYDNVSRLVPEILDILQDDAKDNADDRKYIAVFVCSEGRVPQRMQSRSAWSRADRPVMEIGDLSEKESKDYLVKRCTIEKKEGNKFEKECKINDEEVNELYKLVGGRIVDLKAVVDKFEKGQSLKDIKQQKLSEVATKFDTANLHQDQPYHEAGKSVIKALFNSINDKALSEEITDLLNDEEDDSRFFIDHERKKDTEASIDYLTYRKFFNNPEEANKVLEANVFAYHPEKRIVTFQSRVVECYIRANAYIFK